MLRYQVEYNKILNRKVYYISNNKFVNKSNMDKNTQHNNHVNAEVKYFKKNIKNENNNKNIKDEN